MRGPTITYNFQKGNDTVVSMTFFSSSFSEGDTEGELDCIRFTIGGLNNPLICKSWRLQPEWFNRLLPRDLHDTGYDSSYTRFLCEENFAVCFCAQSKNKYGFVCVYDLALDQMMLEVPFDFTGWREV